MRVLFCLSIVVSALIIQGCASNKDLESYEGKLNFRFDTIYHNYAIDLTKQITGGTDLHVSDTSLILTYNYCGNDQIICLNPLGDDYSVLNLESGCLKVFTKQTRTGYYVLKRDGELLAYDQSGESKIPSAMKLNASGIQGKVLTNLKSDSLLWKLGLDIEQYKPGSGMLYNVSDSIFYFRVMKSFDTDKGFYSKENSGFPIFCRYNLVSGEKRFFGNKPLPVERSWYGLCSEIYDLYIGDSIIVSEGANAQIKIINTLQNKTKTIEVKSRYDTNPIKEFVLPKNRENAKTLKRQHFLESPFYEAIYYNPYTKYYYRIFHPSIDKYNSNGLLNTSYDKPCVLMVFDQNFKLIDEVVIPLKAALTFQIRPIKSGIEVCLPDLNDQTTRNSKFAFLKITHSVR
jgi:hypothetical protein